MRSSRVVAISGKEGSLRRQALQTTLEALAVDEFDIQTFEAGESSSVDWIASAGTAPFLSDRRVTIVRHLLRAEADVAPDKFASLPPSASLILVADDELGDDQRQTRLAAIRTKWENTVRSGGGHVVVCTVDPRDVIPALKAEATALGKQISAQALALLVEMTGQSLSRSIEELNKVALFVGENPQIRELDVQRVAMSSREYNAFKLVDSALSGNPGDALRMLNDLVASRARADDVAHASLFPNLRRQLRLLWQARVVLDHGQTIDTVSSEVAALLPDKPNLLREKEFVQGKIMRLARNLTLDQIAQCMQSLSDADSGLKGLKPSFSGQDTLERLALNLSRTVSR